MNIRNCPLKPQKSKYDPLYLHARREAVMVLIVWLAGLLWIVGYCFFAAYDIPAGQIRLILGMPAWVFWGVLVPWLIIIGFSIWFGLFYIADDEFAQSRNGSNCEHLHNTNKPQTDTDAV